MRKATKSASKPTAKRVRGVERVNGLLPKQAKFVAEYLIDGNATQAAIRAGYSQKSAHVIGQENLKKPAIAELLAQKQTVIAAKQDERLAAMELTKERVAREIARLAYFDPRKLFAPDGSPLPIQDLDSDTAACIAGLEVLEQWEGRGEDRKFIGLLKKYKIAPKSQPLDMAAKILKMYEEPAPSPTMGEMAGAFGAAMAAANFKSLSDADLAALQALMTKANGGEHAG